MANLGKAELLIILVIVVAVFGTGKLASLGGALGRGIKDFRASMQDEEAKSASALEEDEAKSGVALNAASQNPNAESEKDPQKEIVPS
jgi:sec-independent protein translocase protein TatA